MSSPLVTLQARVDDRVRKILETRPAWPCRKGCDHCCRNLASPPVLTTPEWDDLQRGLRAIPQETISGVVQRARELRASGAARPVTCPLLDPIAGACLVYEHRPLFCRTYGFYAERDGGLYCTEILTRTGTGEFGDVIWGNHESLAQDVEAECGPAVAPLVDALAQWPVHRVQSDMIVAK